MKWVGTWWVLLSSLLNTGACREFRGATDASIGAAGQAGEVSDLDVGGSATTRGGSPAEVDRPGLGRDAAGVGSDEEFPPEAAAGAGGVAPEPAVLEPTAFAGLALWLEASPDLCSLQSDSPAGAEAAPEPTHANGLVRVLACGDASGNENHARALDAEHRPLFVPGAVNGHPALRFDREPSLLTIEDSDSIRLGQEPFALLLVMRWSNSVEYLVPEYNGGIAYGGSGALLRKCGLYQPFDGLAIFANYPGPFAQRPAIPRLAVQLEYANGLFFSHSTRLNDNRYRLYVVRRPAAGVGQIRINGQTDSEAQLPLELDVSGSEQPMTLGGWDEAPFRGELAELIAIGGAVEDVDLRGLERHLLHKYGLVYPAER